MAQLLNTTIDDTGFIALPAGATGTRPGSPVAGMVRYNTTLNQTEYWDGLAWRSVSDTGVEATGGTIIDTEIGGVPYRIHEFTTVGGSTFAVTKGGEVEVLVVGGGGGSGGGGNTGYHGGGGGGGGVVYSPRTLVSSGNITVTVGDGGVAGVQTGDSGFRGGNGNNSAFGALVANGGGGGGGNAESGGRAGGSGGGGNLYAGAGGTSNQPSYGTAVVFGNSGGVGQSDYGSAGGGGGAGSAGAAGVSNIGGTGGQGIANSITGTVRYYGGGGGGAGNSVQAPSINGSTAAYTPGAPNSGQGGGGRQSVSGLAGGSGIVVVRYRRNASTATNPNRTLVSLLPNSSPTSFIVTEGLVLNFDASDPASYPGTGTVFNNLANLAVPGTINNSPTFERASPDNGRFVFNGSNTFISTSNFFLGNGNIAWTLSAWVNTTTAADGLGLGAVASNASGGPVYSSLGVNAGRISYWTYEGAWLRRIGNITVNDGRWHLLTWVNKTDSTIDMYVDGILDVRNQRSVSGNNNPIDRFGGSWAGIFDGRISTFTINLNRSLSEYEVLQTFNATRWRFGV